MKPIISLIEYLALFSPVSFAVLANVNANRELLGLAQFDENYQVQQ